MMAKKLKKTRASVGFPSDQYERLEQLAEDKKVSIGWVVREAVEQYLADNREDDRGEGKEK